nr:acetyltransf_4 [uncultured bacterium]
MDKIVIRHAEPSDASAIKDIYSQSNAYAGTLQLPYPSEKLWESRMDSIPDNVYSFVATIDGRVVGNLGFEVYKNPRRRHAGSLGIGVHDEFLRRGVGAALLTALLDLADNWLNIQRIEITVYTDNKAAIALYEKFGFKTEGVSSMYAFRNGEYADVNHMARIKGIKHDR